MVFKRSPLYLTLLGQLGNTSESYSTSMDHAPPLMTSPTELGLLLSFPPLNQQIGSTFDNNPTVLAILRYYCFITQNMDHLHLNLERHDIERTDLFRHLMNSHAFQDDIRPLIEEYRQRIRRNEPYDRRPEPPRTPSDSKSEEPSLSVIHISPEDIPLPTSNESSNPSILVTIPIHDRASSSLSFSTKANRPTSKRHRLINTIE